VKIESLDHVALWVADRDALAEFMTAHVGMHVIEHTDAFTIVGADARRGKLTLFAAEGRREPGPLERVVLRVRDLERALERLPDGLDVDRTTDGVARFDAPEGLGLGLVEGNGVDYDIDHVVLRMRDRDAALAEFADLGFDARDGRLWAGDTYMWLDPGGGKAPARPLLNHLALLVKSAEEHIEEARRRALDIADIKDAANTYALFVWGPERVQLEYVEHKASFSLV
jgi:catechol 2,3-dioxygenase-like lactoylglutathione lyase family enzyme